MNPRTFRLAAGLALAAVFLAGCHGTDYWVGKLQADPLYQRSEKVRDSGTCGKIVSMDFGRSYPVPVRGGGDEFKVLFYPLFVSPQKSEMLTPAFVGGFSRGAADAHCEKIAGASKPVSLGAPVPAGLSMKAYYRADAALYPALDKTAALYAGGGPLSDADKKFLVDFDDAFAVLAEPGLLPDYYRLNPDFWEWLRRECGRSIPKPAA